MGEDSGACRAALDEQVGQHLLDAPPVGRHPRQVRRQVDEDGVPAAAAEERVPGPVDQRAHLRGLGIDGQGAGLDAPGVHQVADQAGHVIGLLVDDAEELPDLGRIEGPGGAQHRGGRALDGGQGGAQLMADQAQELGPHALQFLQRGQVLHGDDHRGDGIVLGVGSEWH